MTSRFERLTVTRKIIIIGLLAMLPAIQVPDAAAAQTAQNKMLAFEINNIQIITIPEIPEINKTNHEPEETPAPVIEAPKPKNYVPPKVEGDERVYMHEPKIREYLCPIMGAKQCNIFIAVLKAENGTHECTRDNRGLNRNGSIDVGLAQINWNPKHNPPYTLEQLRDCKFNLDIALKKYETRGFQPWYAYTKGAYKKFLKPAPVTAAKIQ